MVIGELPPVFGVIYVAEAAARAWDSGFTVIWDDAPHESELHRGPGGQYDDPRVSVVCLHCLIDDSPELGRGLDLARVHGQVDWDDEGGFWFVTETGERL